MCVIIICEKAKPSQKIIEMAEDSNPDGAGIAWIQSNLVHWRKGLKGKEIIKIAKSTPLPFAIHFRLGTVGEKIPSLCHPFSVSETPSLSLEGKTRGKVLMHNGHWGNWKRICLEGVIKTGKKFPSAPCSDSRAIAWLAYHFGLGILTLIEEKICIISTKGIKTFGEGWRYYENMLVSNILFLNHHRNSLHSLHSLYY